MVLKKKKRTKEEYIFLNTEIAQKIGGTFRITKGIPQIVTKHKVIATKYLNYHKDWNELIKVIKILKEKSNIYDVNFKEIVYSLEDFEVKKTYEEVVKYLRL